MKAADSIVKDSIQAAQPPNIRRRYIREICDMCYFEILVKILRKAIAIGKHLKEI